MLEDKMIALTPRAIFSDITFLDNGGIYDLFTSTFCWKASNYQLFWLFGHKFLFLWLFLKLYIIIMGMIIVL